MIRINYEKDITLLLDLDGYIIDQANGYWTKFEAWRASRNENIPHGIRYSLTLHDRLGQRIMGFDNAHAIKGSNRTSRKTYDHRHRHKEDPGVHYEFVSAQQLLTDFWLEVDKTLYTLGIEQETPNK